MKILVMDGDLDQTHFTGFGHVLRDQRATDVELLGDFILGCAGPIIHVGHFNQHADIVVVSHRLLLIDFTVLQGAVTKIKGQNPFHIVVVKANCRALD
jgi:hypothetical protein